MKTVVQNNRKKQKKKLRKSSVELTFYGFDITDMRRFTAKTQGACRTLVNT